MPTSVNYSPAYQMTFGEIKRFYGHDLIFDDKLIRKFGSTANADSGVRTTIAQFQDDVVNETFATGNTIDYVVSTSGSDTGPVRIEGHILDDTTGAISFKVQTITLTGQTPAPLTYPLYRGNRLYNPEGTFASPSTAFVGNIALYDSVLANGTTSGKPDTDTAVKCLIVAGDQQSEKLATTVESNKWWFIDLINVHATRGSSTAVVDVDVEIRRPGGVWRPAGLQIIATTQTPPSRFVQPLIIPPGSDVRAVAVSSGTNVSVSGRMAGPLFRIN